MKNGTNQTFDSDSKLAEQIYFAAVDIDDENERKTFITKSCAGNDAVRQKVETLFSLQDKAEKVFAACHPAQISAADIADALAESPEFFARTKATRPNNNDIGKQVGNYTLLQKIGEGGVGIVYLAQQNKPVRRQVALKIIKAGMDTKSVIARFEAERQALAIMEHPNIAHVLNAGETETGRPYFVMELVHGERITTYCDKHRLSIRQRLKLFIEICHAIQHAHQKGIIHRDIKPSNVLITVHDGIPSPVVIDFGIAKATTADFLTDKTVNTGIGPIIGTPAYMSPEQANQSPIDIDTRSDIYSLGVLLYEMLISVTPVDQKELLKSGMEEMYRTLREHEPTRPSVKLRQLDLETLEQIEDKRGMTLRKLGAMLSGDLDWIVMKALEKDRARRYESASELAMDVEHFLNNEPVAARPPSNMYRMQKLVRRNKSTFASIAAITVTLMAGFGTSIWLFIRERHALRLAERAQQSEMTLRAEADARARIAQAALLISRNKNAEADQLLQRIQIPVTEPSLEAANVFRTLAHWHVTQGRWKEAADCFLNLQQANQLDKSNTTKEITSDLLGAGPSVIVAGETQDYHRFVQQILVRFAGTSDPTAAEQVVKNSLILPPDAATLQQLDSFVKVVKHDIAAHESDTTGSGYHLGWRTMALSLYEYRCGHFSEAIQWGKKSLNYADRNPPRVAMTHIVMAMAYAGLNQPENARTELQAGRTLIEEKFPSGTGKISSMGSASSGMWHEWLIGHLLLREAVPLVEETSTRHASD